MSSLALVLALALTPGHATRGAHESEIPDVDVTTLAPSAPVAVVVWHEDQLVITVAPEPPPVPVDPVRFLGRTRIRLRSGFTPRTLNAAEHIRL
jgi:hypothetical protein